MTNILPVTMPRFAIPAMRRCSRLAAAMLIAAGALFVAHNAQAGSTLSEDLACGIDCLMVPAAQAPSSKPRPQGDDSCPFANDGACDEPANCEAGTDSSDCRDRNGKPIPNSCHFANDGACDEPHNCAAGTDSADCRDGSGYPIPDSCHFARDGECDEPEFCITGTDTTDCSS